MEKKPFYDKVNNKQKMSVFCTFFHEILYDSNELHENVLLYIFYSSKICLEHFETFPDAEN